MKIYESIRYNNEKGDNQFNLEKENILKVQDFYCSLKTAKNVSSTYSPKLLDQVKKSVSAGFQTASIASNVQIKL